MMMSAGNKKKSTKRFSFFRRLPFAELEVDNEVAPAIKVYPFPSFLLAPYRVLVVTHPRT